MQGWLAADTLRGVYVLGRRLRLIVAMFLAMVAALVACDTFGTASAPNPAAGDAGTPIDARADALGTEIPDVSVGPCDEDASSTCGDLKVVPAGWAPVIFSTSKLSCPGGFSGSSLVADPQVQADACTYTAAARQAPTCSAGTVTRTNGPNVCPFGADSFIVTGNCDLISGTVGVNEGLVPVPSSGGSCTAASAADGSKMKTVGG